MKPNTQSNERAGSAAAEGRRAAAGAQIRGCGKQRFICNGNRGLAEVRIRSSIKGRVGMQIQAWADARSCATAHSACNCLKLCNGRWSCSWAVHNAAMHSCQRVQLLGGRVLPTCSIHCLLNNRSNAVSAWFTLTAISHCSELGLGILTPVGVGGSGGLGAGYCGKCKTATAHAGAHPGCVADGGGRHSHQKPSCRMPARGARHSATAYTQPPQQSPTHRRRPGCQRRRPGPRCCPPGCPSRTAWEDNALSGVKRVKLGSTSTAEAPTRLSITYCRGQCNQKHWV